MKQTENTPKTRPSHMVIGKVEVGTKDHSANERRTLQGMQS